MLLPKRFQPLRRVNPQAASLLLSTGGGPSRHPDVLHRPSDARYGRSSGCPACRSRPDPCYGSCDKNTPFRLFFRDADAVSTSKEVAEHWYSASREWCRGMLTPATLLSIHTIFCRGLRTVSGFHHGQRASRGSMPHPRPDFIAGRFPPLVTIGRFSGERPH
jgi:hypothetical protein